MKKVYYFVLTGFYLAMLLLLHALGAIVGFVGVVFTIAAQLLMLQPKSVGKVWQVYVLSVKFF